jgi:formylglycine-generating enzyme required for sulfatase activity
MAWGRLALIHAAGESDDTLEKIAQLFGYEHEPRQVIAEQGFSSTTELGITTTADDNAEQIPKRPPALFIVISQSKTKPSITPELDTPSGSPPELTTEGSYRFKAAEPLLTMARLTPLLHNGLGQKRKGNNLDLNRLSSQLAKGKALKHLPYLPRVVWSQRLQIIVDARLDLEPYWLDFEFIVHELKQRLGQEAVSAIRFDEDSINHEQAYCLPYPASSNDSWQLWQEPANDVAVLILSDLNAKHWRYLSKRLQPRTAPILTLSPSHNTPNDINLCQLLKPNPLNDSQPVRRHPYQKGFTLPELPESKRCEIFALLSALPLIDAALLRRLRKALNWGGSELEHFIWQHPDMADNGLGIYFPNETAEHYRSFYPKDSEDFWKIVHEHHETAFQGLKCLEGLNQYAMQPNKRLNDKIKRYYYYLAERLNSESSNSALQAQAQTVIALTPNCILDTELKQLLHRIAALSHNETQRQQLLNQGYDLYQLIPTSPETQIRDWYIVQQGQGQFCLQTNAQPLSIATLSTKHTPVQIDSNGKQQLIQQGQVFTLNENDSIHLETETEQLELKVIQKPAWANRIWRDSHGLFVNVDWGGESYTLPWRITEHSDWGWIRSPLNRDQYGVYADLTINGVTQRFRWIKAGTFLMGSPKNEPERYDDEIQHQVTLTQGYWLADTACTQALWQAVMDNNPAYFKDDLNNPVEQISWNDVKTFLDKLNQRIPNLNARLPTEAEWEYACRAGTQTPFSFGDTITPEQVNYDGNYPYNNAEKGLYRNKTVAVKSLPPNDWGLYEMHGNVWEWCNDWYADYPNEAVTNPTDAIEGDRRVLRGGSWFDLAGHTRSANRNNNTPDNQNLYIGFRFALGQTVADRQARTVTTDRQAAAQPVSGDDAGGDNKNFFSRILDKIKPK